MVDAHANGRTKAGKVTVAGLARWKRLPADFLRGESVNLQDLENGVGIPYYGPTGEELFVRERLAYEGKYRFHHPDGVATAPYGRWRLDQARLEGHLHIVEGESNCWALWFHKLPALGLPGAGHTDKLTPEDLSGVPVVYVHRDPDQGGDAFCKGVGARLAELGWQGNAYELRMPQAVKDVSDLHAGGPMDFEAAMVGCVEASKPLTLPPPPGPAPEPWKEILPLSETPAAQPFPLEVLPPPVRRFVKEVAWAFNCPPDFAAVPVLAVAGGAIGNTHRLGITRSHHQSACLFAAVIGTPGSLKSPALERVVEPLEVAERRQHLECKRLQAEWKKADPDERGDRPPRPKRTLLDETTTETIASVLEDNERGVLMVRDELAALVCGLNQYKQGKGNDRQTYLKLWSHATIRVDRKGNANGMPVQVFRPFVAIVGGIQPKVLDQLRGSARDDDGFLDRFLLSYPEDLPAAEESWREVSAGAAEGWAHVVDWLLEKKMVQEDDGTQRPWLNRLTAPGREAWAAFTREHAAELNREDFPSHLRGAWSKLRGYCGRLALIVHLLRLASRETAEPDVDGESMARAAVLVRYFKEHARRVYSVMAADRETEAARRLLEWISRKDVKEFKRWEAHKALSSQEWFPRIESLDQPIDRLIKHHYLRVRPSPKKAGAGRTADPVYEVNPCWDRRVNRVNRVNAGPDGHLPDLPDLPDDPEGEHGDAWEPPASPEAVSRNPFRNGAG